MHYFDVLEATPEISVSDPRLEVLASMPTMPRFTSPAPSAPMETRRSLHEVQDLLQVLAQARVRALHPHEVASLLTNVDLCAFFQSKRPLTQRPRAGDMFVFDRYRVMHFRKDGYERAKPATSTRQRVHVGNVVIVCVSDYTLDGLLERRIYWLAHLPEKHSHVLVHYISPTAPVEPPPREQHRTGPTIDEAPVHAIALCPDHGPVAGGFPVTVHGVFPEGTVHHVLFGDVPVQPLRYGSDGDHRHFVIYVPPSTRPGPAAVVVVDGDGGRSRVLRFQYCDAITAMMTETPAGYGSDPVETAPPAVAAGYASLMGELHDAPPPPIFDLINPAGLPVLPMAAAVPPETETPPPAPSITKFSAWLADNEREFKLRLIAHLERCDKLRAHAQAPSIARGASFSQEQQQQFEALTTGALVGEVCLCFEQLGAVVRGGALAPDMLEAVSRLLLEELQWRDDLGFAVIHIASFLGMEDEVGRFIALGANVNARDQNGFTPLHWAATCGHSGIAEILLQHNALLNPRDDSGIPPIDLALANRHDDVALLLAERGFSDNTLAESDDADAGRSSAPPAVVSPTGTIKDKIMMQQQQQLASQRRGRRRDSGSNPMIGARWWENRRERAARKIQDAYRYHRLRLVMEDVQDEAATKIQRLYRGYRQKEREKVAAIRIQRLHRRYMAARRSQRRDTDRDRVVSDDELDGY